MTKRFYKGHFLVIIFTAILLFHSNASAAEIIAVQSVNIKPYQKAFQGYKTACGCNVKQLIASEMEGTDIAKKIYEGKPDIILAIGIDALREVREIKDVPIIYFMILNPQLKLSGRGNITGVSLYINPEKQLYALNEALPSLKKVGLLYDPAVTGDFVRKARAASEAAGIELIIREVYSSKDVPETLRGIKGEINALWMLPDLTVITPETVEFLMLFSIDNRIPVITFSDKYLEMGALMSISISAGDIGEQAWDMTEMVLSGKDIRTISGIDARKAKITFNQRAAKKLGIAVSKKAAGQIRIINRE